MESPECPVCLEPYDERSTVPRVLACGHSVCEQCIAALPTPLSALPDAVRCPACNQVVPFPRSLGYDALPKNIDLLRLISSSSSHPLFPSSASDAKSKPSSALQFSPLSGDQRLLYSTWKYTILPPDAISPVPAEGTTAELLVATMSSPLGGPWFSSTNQLVSLLPIVTASSSSKEPGWFRLSYTASVVEAMHELGDRVRDELRFLAEATWKERRGLCRVYGFWMNPEKERSNLYLVSESFDRTLSDVLKKKRKLILSGGSVENFLAFGKTSLDLCEAVMGLHSQGIICGCLMPSCICFDESGHCLIDLNKVLLTGRQIWQAVSSCAPNGGGDNYGEAENQVFISPEVLLQVYDEDASNCGFKGALGYGSDVWSLACILVILVTGDELPATQVLNGWFCVFDKGKHENFVESYDAWKVIVVSKLEMFLLGTQFEPLLHILTSCLSYEVQNRPQVYDIWHCIQRPFVENFLYDLHPWDGLVAKDTFLCCLVLGNLFSLHKNSPNVSPREVNSSVSKNVSDVAMIGRNVSDGEHLQQEKIDGDFVKGLYGGHLKSVSLQGHKDCVTGLAIGGGFLFSSSFDKTINVWSLQDFSHFQSLKGHEHRVTALLVSDDGNKPFCISGDSGSGIFLWSIGPSLGQEPWKKWYEHNDWRYSGIHCLAVSGTGYLYSGSGDKSIKAWSMQVLCLDLHSDKDYSLSFTMVGHKSTVSSLAVANGFLYSGSWDGTIRLWWLHDHSPLAVLGDEAPGNSTPILSLSVKSNLLISSHENGVLKVWSNDVLVKSEQIQDGAIFALYIDRGSIFAGGWDKTIHIQELSENELDADIGTIASINCDSVITSLLYWHGRLFAGFSNKEIKVYYNPI
ncbi:uncharacterized protein LOC135629639 isoform X3 [Musa acuminata AAA Group]|uniref:uncharacterized protein LOC135629639 isoform X3 n=1 Tax=Musa acuminata AAA Group TaxID=214697 RepID=UPI0031D7873D